MSVNQFQDDGAVIGYRPTLQYVKEHNTNVSAEESKQSSATDYSGKTKYSKTIQHLQNNLPSTSLSNIDEVLKNMQILVDKLSSSFQNGNWNQYGEISSLLSAIESKDESYIDKFIAYHQNSITGSIVPELIGLLYDEEKRLEALSILLKELYYGDVAISIEDARQKDEGYLQKLQAFESDKNMASVNYVAVANDASVNRSVNMYVFGANAQAINIANVITKVEAASTDSSKASLIMQYFDDTNNEIKYRKDSYNQQQSIEIMQKTLYNYYNKRKELIDLYDIFGNNSESIFLGNKLQMCRHRLEDAIINVNRSFVGNQHYLSEIAKLESEKHFLKNLYASFNYNSNV